MKLMHLSDLHLGKRVNDFSMIEDQKYILNQILESIEKTKVDAILIAGDLYDKTVPPTEAVEIFDEFLTSLSRMKIPVFVISGNHDSAERVSFGSRIMQAQGVYISNVFNGTIKPNILKDEFGEVNIYILPFIKPAHVKRFYEDVEIDSYEDAVKKVIEIAQVDKTKRNILVAHQFITSAGESPKTCDSENSSVGGLDNIDASVFDDFDYVALGHLHGPQSIGRETIRYCGSPLKYSFSESRQKKSITLIKLGAKGGLTIDTVPLVPKRDMREIKGPIYELLSVKNYIETNTEDYMHITLTDEDEILDAIGKVHTVYPNVMRLDYDNKRSRALNEKTMADSIKIKTPLELFKEFYELQNNLEMDKTKLDIVSKLLEELGGNLDETN